MQGMILIFCGFTTSPNDQVKPRHTFGFSTKMYYMLAPNVVRCAPFRRLREFHLGTIRTVDQGIHEKAGTFLSQALGLLAFSTPRVSPGQRVS